MNRKEELKKGIGFSEGIKNQFRKNALAVFALRTLVCFVFIALLADFLANEKPLVSKYKGVWYFPQLKSYIVDLGLSTFPEGLRNISWKDVDFEYAIFPPVPYSPENIDYENSQCVSPFRVQHISSLRWKHWLGTDELGRDVLSGLIHGTRYALTVGVVSMSIAVILGILLGSLAGYFGDTKLKIVSGSAVIYFICISLGLFYAFDTRWFCFKDAISESFFNIIFQVSISFFILLLFILSGWAISKFLFRLNIFTKKISVPADLIIMRLIEIQVSVPVLFLIVAILAISKPSLYLVMVIIGFSSWTSIAKYVRAELLRIRNLEYMESARSLGFSDFRILVRHALPNAISPVLIAVAFGISNAILIESSLSFLGIGVPPEVTTWGSLIAEARVSPSAWWLAVFPGAAIFVTVTCCNLIGEGLTDALDPKLRK